jgi:hypothetical protein
VLRAGGVIVTNRGRASHPDEMRKTKKPASPAPTPIRTIGENQLPAVAGGDDWEAPVAGRNR